jgi:hypothetical protein
VFQQSEPVLLGSVYKGPAVKGSLRIGPIGQDRRPLASLWRIWAQGDEVYIANRNGAKLVKISIHSSGKPFISVGKNDRWNFAQPMLLPDSAWQHIVEICFLIGEKILPLRDMKELKPSKPALGIVTPAGHKLAIYVLSGRPPLTHESPIPAVMHGGSIIFQHTLRGGDLLAVVARVLPMSDQDIGFINEVRSGLAVNTDTPVQLGKNIGIEAMWLRRSATTGNVIGVIPAGPEVYTSGVVNA